MAIRLKTLSFPALGLLSFIYSGYVSALAFRADVMGEPVGVLVDAELAYGARWRVQERDSDLVSPGNGGTRSNGNGNIVTSN